MSLTFGAFPRRSKTAKNDPFGYIWLHLATLGYTKIGAIFRSENHPVKFFLRHFCSLFKSDFKTIREIFSGVQEAVVDPLNNTRVILIFLSVKKQIPLSVDDPSILVPLLASDTMCMLADHHVRTAFHKFPAYSLELRGRIAIELFTAMV